MNNKIQISLILLATLGIMSSITVVSSLPLISRTFSHIDNIEFLSKLILSIPAIIIAIFAPFAGHLSDKYGRLKPLYFGIFLFILGGSSGFYLENFYFILIGRAILGFGVAFIMTSSTALIGDYFTQEQRHKFMSKQGLAIGIGGITFISLGGVLAQIHWSYPFAIYILPLLFMPFLYKNLYEPNIKEEVYSDININPKLLNVYFTAFFVMVLFYMLPTQLPYFIVNILHSDAKTVGFIIATSMMFNAITSMQYAKIKSKFTYIQIYAFTFSLFSIGLFVISQVTNVTQMYFATLPIGMAFGLLIVNTNAWFQSKVSIKNRAKSSGILTSSFFIGQFASPILFEPIVLKFGVQGLFLSVSILSLIISLTIFFKQIYK